MTEYDKIANWYAANRSPEAGIPDVSEFVRVFPPGSKILDLGCGNGIPISQFLLLGGFEVFGIDSSKEMIARFRSNCPDAHAQCARIKESDFFNTTFDAVVAWGVLLHLSRADQVEAIARISGIVKLGGRFLFTGGDQDGIVESAMDSVQFRYISLGANCYRNLLREHGFDVLDEHCDTWDNYVFVAEKRASNG